MKLSTPTLIGCLTHISTEYKQDPKGRDKMLIDAANRLADLERENSRLRGDLLINPTPSLSIHRFALQMDHFTRTPEILTHPEGEYVMWKDYEWMSNYADRLVEFANLPCLPKDLDNLREANARLAAENHDLQTLQSLQSLQNDENSLTP